MTTHPKHFAIALGMLGALVLPSVVLAGNPRTVCLRNCDVALHAALQGAQHQFNVCKEAAKADLADKQKWHADITACTVQKSVTIRTAFTARDACRGQCPAK